MRLRKAKTRKGYSLTFEITPEEAQRSELFLTWHSDNQADYIELLATIANVSSAEQRNETFFQFDDFIFNSSGQAAFAPQFGRQRYNPPKPTPEPSWVKVLGLGRDATKNEIKAAYRKLAKVNHPDKGGDPVKFAKIQAAYDEAMA